MHQYVKDTEFAVANLLKLAIDEEQRLSGLKKTLTTLEAKETAYKWDFETSDMNDDFSDAYVMAAFHRMAEARQAAKEIERKAAEIQAAVGAHQHATQAIAGGVLQIAKQGISLVFGKKGHAPMGRQIGVLPIRDIIWEGRNQALHYEEANYKKAVKEVFSALEQDHGEHFSLESHGHQSRAKQVLYVLGWFSFDDYARDMNELLS
ncbi:MAG: PPE family [Marinobacter excellens HL-55]|uniref:PPE family n=1 Tax=Marinobacter excellens HL-55 TaxID=1305731 RepID=A0A0P7Z6H4_9GAMM|nr:MAG: PPE family [Marinobacter excellens HL-55]